MSLQHRQRAAGLALILLVGGAILLVALRLRQSGFHWHTFVSMLGQLDWFWMAAAVFFIILAYIGRAVRWEVLLRRLRPSSSRWNLISATLIGYTAVFLFGRAGEMVRPYLIAAKEKLPFSSQLAAWVLERFYDLLIILALFGYALSQLDRSALSAKTTHWLQVSGQFVWIAALLAVGALLFSQQLSKLVGAVAGRAIRPLPERFRGKAQHMVDAFVHGLHAAGEPRTVLLMTLYTILEWALITGCYYCLFQGFPGTRELSLRAVILFVAFVSFGGVVQLPGVGGGMQLAAIVVLTEIFGLSLEAATGMALLLWLITIAVVVPFGVFCAVREGITWRKLKQLEEEARA